MKLKDLIYSDYLKYRRYGSHFIAIVFLTQGFWACFQYRIANAIYYGVKIRFFRKLLMLTMILWQKLIEILTGISMPASARIGHSLYVGHFGGIIINSNAVIGNNCNIGQCVTIGVSGLSHMRGVPQIGNNVYIGANAVVAGKIIVGDNVLIGASSLVNRNVPDNATVLGVPAVVMSMKGSKGYI